MKAIIGKKSSLCKITTTQQIRMYIVSRSRRRATYDGAKGLTRFVVSLAEALKLGHEAAILSLLLL